MRVGRLRIEYPGGVKRFGDFLVNSPAALQLGGTTVVLLVLFLIPALHPIAWIIGLLAVVVLAGVLVLWFLEWRRTQDRIDQLNARLAKAHAAIGGVSLSPVAEDEPSADTVRAERIRELFPTGSGLVQELRVESGFSPLPTALVAPLREFLDEFSHASFENPASHFAFMDLYRAGTALTEWLDSQTQDTAGKLEMVPGDVREGGWRGFAEAREAGQRRIDAFLSTRQAFERTALENDVLG